MSRLHKNSRNYTQNLDIFVDLVASKSFNLILLKEQRTTMSINIDCGLIRTGVMQAAYER
jgi:hypothetical protein